MGLHPPSKLKTNISFFFKKDLAVVVEEEEEDEAAADSAVVIDVEVVVAPEAVEVAAAADRAAIDHVPTNRTVKLLTEYSWLHVSCESRNSF